MKPLPPHFDKPTHEPREFVEDMSPDRQAALREAFKPIARTYRRTKHVMIALFCFVVLCLFLRVFLPKPLGDWAWDGCFVGFAAALVVAVRSPAPFCPGCTNKLDRKLGPYCPECGARALERDEWYSWPKCLQCRRVMYGAKRRKYRIRACTHCGVWLDDRGL